MALMNATFCLPFSLSLGIDLCLCIGTATATGWGLAGLGFCRRLLIIIGGDDDDASRGCGTFYVLLSSYGRL
jgi:hypothetical protein